MGDMTPFWKLSAAGFAATAITYGPARMGFGLFLSEFRSAFSISTDTAGVVSGMGFLGMLTGLIVAYAMTARHGPRLPVLCGLLAATLGMATVALAPNLPVLAAGVFLAMSSTGFAWSPFNNAVRRQVTDEASVTALSIISAGTGLGIAAAGATALLLGLGDMPWRIGWATFSLAAGLALAGNIVALRDVAGHSGLPATEPWDALLCRPALPLYGIALSYGITTAIYISFATDRAEGAGGLAFVPEGLTPAVMFLALGLFGLVGLFTGRAKQAVGLAGLIRCLMLAAAVSHALVALLPTSAAGLLLSTALQGAFVMMMSAIFSFWSERLFPLLPALSFTAVLIAVAAGSVIGPVAAGFMAGTYGPEAMFLATGGVSALTAAGIASGQIRERAAAPAG